MSSILDNLDVRRSALPISVEQYHQLGRSGIISERTELIRGVILGKMIKSPQHTWLVQTLANIFRDSLDPGRHLRQEQPLTLDDSEPEPDIAIIAGSSDDFRDKHPTTAQLVIEVAISSVELDREKAVDYAAAGVPEYWVFLPEQQTVEVYQQPANGRYEKSTVLRREQTLSWNGIPQLQFALNDLFDKS